MPNRHGAQQHKYSNIGIAILKGRLWAFCMGSKKFHHYFFCQEIHVITDHKLFVAIFKKDVAMLSQCIQHILLKIHQYRVQILYKTRPEIFIADWLLQHNYHKGKDELI